MTRPLGGDHRAFVAALVGLTAWKLALTIALMIGLGLTEGISLLLLVPLLQVVGLDVQPEALGGLPARLVGVLGAFGLRPTLALLLAIYVAIITAYAALNRWQTVAAHDLQEELIFGLRARLFRSITNADWLFLARSRASDFTHALTSELNRVGLATVQLLAVVVNSAVAGVYVLFALQTSPAISCIVLLSGALLFAVLRRPARVAQLTGEEISLASGGLYAASIEYFGAMKTVKSHGAEERTIALFTGLSKTVGNIFHSAIRGMANAKFWFDVGAVLILSLVVYLALEVVGIPIGALFLLLFLFARLMPRLSAIQQNFQYYVSSLPAYTAVSELQARCDAAAAPIAARSEPIELLSAVRLAGVSFAYEPSGEPLVLESIDLQIRAGQTTALVGSSGVGKSTAADLILGLLQPSRGEILVDDLPLTAARLAAWRAQIGYVAQDAVLFHETVRANLLWAAPRASEQELREALSLAAADEFVCRLPLGLDTVIGDRGVRLSGGERQRLALARALVRRPALLILDEATSSLDSDNERRIQRAIERLHGSMTILVITHRLSTIRGTDLIYLLENGHLVESGSWDELLDAEHGRFRALCRAQDILATEARSPTQPRPSG